MFYSNPARPTYFIAVNAEYISVSKHILQKETRSLQILYTIISINLNKILKKNCSVNQSHFKCVHLNCLVAQWLALHSRPVFKDGFLRADYHVRLGSHYPSQQVLVEGVIGEKTVFMFFRFCIFQRTDKQTGIKASSRSIEISIFFRGK